MFPRAALNKRSKIIFVGTLFVTGLAVWYWYMAVKITQPDRVITYEQGNAHHFAVDADGNIFLAYNKVSYVKVVKIDPDGLVVDEYWFDLEGSMPETAVGFRDICLDTEGNIYMLNRQTQELLVVSNRGKMSRVLPVNFDIPEDSANQLHWLGVDKTGVYFFVQKEEQNELVNYLVRVDIATQETVAKRFAGYGAHLPDDPLYNGSIFTFSTVGTRGFKDG